MIQPTTNVNSSNPTGGNVWSERRKITKRNRKISFGLDHVSYDVNGNITSMPLTKSLPCFANPIEYLWGETDRPYIHYDRAGGKHERAIGCAGCKVKPACNTIAQFRIDADNELRSLFETWQDATSSLPKADRHRHPTWVDFCEACEARSWTSSNDEALEEDKKLANARAKKRRKEARKRKRRVRAVEPKVIAAIDAERDRRCAILLSARADPKTPLYVRNLSEERCALTADVWHAEQILTRSRQRASAAGIARWLILRGKDCGLSEQSLRQRVNEALKRVARLEEEPAGNPRWAEFDL